MQDIESTQCDGAGEAHERPRLHVIHVDLPVFASPDTALGYFCGNIEVVAMPVKGNPFPWPAGWLSSHRDLFLDQPGQVWCSSPWDGTASRIHFTLFGIVCRDLVEARSLVAHLECVSGMQFWERDRRTR